MERRKQIIESAFVNREGSLKNISEDSFQFIFEATEDGYGCLHLGMYEVEENAFVKEKIVSWQWIDEDPDESCDMLEIFSQPIVM